MFLPVGDNFRKTSFPVVSVLLILINVVVYVYVYYLQSVDDAQFSATTLFFNSFGLTDIELGKLNLFTLLSYMFLHGTLLHLIGNMIVLWAFSRTLEAGLGKVKFLCFYLLWGILAGLLHIALNPSQELPLVGASGAVAGLIGSYTIVYGSLGKIKTFVFVGLIARLQVPAILFGAIWFSFQLFCAIDESGVSLVAWFAHIGGFTSGAISLMFFKNDLRENIVSDSDGSLSISQSIAVTAA